MLLRHLGQAFDIEGMTQYHIEIFNKHNLTFLLCSCCYNACEWQGRCRYRCDTGCQWACDIRVSTEVRNSTAVCPHVPPSYVVSLPPPGQGLTGLWWLLPHSQAGSLAISLRQPTQTSHSLWRNGDNLYSTQAIREGVILQLIETSESLGVGKACLGWG